MNDPLNYGLIDRRERLSRSGITSVVSGLVGFSFFIFLLLYHPSTRASESMKWLITVPLVAVPVLGFACGIRALAVRKRFWWIAFFGLPLCGFPVAIVALVLLRRIF